MATNQPSEVIQHLRRSVLLQDGAGLTDRQLLEDYLARRDQAALAALVRRHGPMVWGVCRRVLRSHEDAEDAFQATFLVLVRKAASIVPRQLVANWLYGVAHRTALNARATAARRKQRERQVTHMPEPAVTEQDIWNDLQRLLDAELSRLPDKYRAVIVLCDLEGKTRKEAARQIGVPEGTVAGRLARARVMVAKRLSQRGVALTGGAFAAVLSQEAASAAVPNSVVDSTVQAASLLAAGKAAGAAAMSATVAALTEGVLKTMMLSKLKNAAAALLVVFVVTAGAGAVISRTSPAQPPEEKNVKDAEKAVKDAEKALNEARRALNDAKEKPLRSGSDRGEGKIRTRWEYKALSHDEIKALEFARRGTDTAEGGLNMLGDEGWELVAIEPPVPGALPNLVERPALYVFKRQKN
jgi:RNA polymerase sigma factor (sigma-70 family)